MIEISMTGMCKDCKCADLHTEQTYVSSADGKSLELIWDTFCSHEEACERAEKLTMERMKKESEWYG